MSTSRVRRAIWLCCVAALASSSARAHADDKKPSFLSAAALTKFGVSIGAAAAFHTPREIGGRSKRSDDQRDWSVSAMPYVVLLPAYWRPMGSVTREYCSTRFLKFSSREAKRAADEYADGLARAAYEKEVAAGCKPGTTCAQINEKRTPKAWEQAKAAVGTLDPVRAYAGWDTAPEMVGRCHMRLFGARWLPLPEWIGIYLGVPLSYSAAFGPDEDKHHVRPTASLGFSVVPSPYFNLLIGFTQVNVEVAGPEVSKAVMIDPGAVETTTESSTKHLRHWQLTIGLGGTLDTIGSLIKL